MTQEIVDFFIGVLSLPTKVASSLFEFLALFKITPTEGNLAVIAILVNVFLLLLPALIDRWKSVPSRLFSAYCLLSLIVAVYLEVATNYLTVFQVSGIAKIQDVVSETKSETFPTSRYGSDSCDADQTFPTRLCSQTLPEVAKATSTISSANCGSGLQSMTVDPSDKRCVNVVAHLHGCGYDHLPFGINNCRGRGWLEYQITVYGSAPHTTTGSDAPFDGYVRKGRPFIFGPSFGALKTNQQLIYSISVHDGDGKEILLTNEKPSSGDFSSAILPNGSIEVSFAKVRV